MGKGDKKTRRGKITMGTFGVRRPRKRNKPVVVVAVKKKAKPATKAKTAAKQKVIELKGFVKNWKIGDVITVDYFNDDTWLDVSGISKGKGFQGVVKRYNFKGVGDATHGQHNRLRAPGSLGASSYPSRVFKGMRMGGRMGGQKTKILNLRVVKIIPENNLLLLKGSVPGPKGSYLIIEK